jgi:hypothetical protein
VPDSMMSAPFGDNPELRPLLRMRRLAHEIRDGLARGDMEIVGQASLLLAPSLAEWNERSAELETTPGEAVQIAMDTHSILNECEQTLTNAMNHVSDELRRLRRAQRGSQSVRSVPPSVFGLRLNLER